ncbi:MAG: ArnT family glycosyltransferase, partial [Candidatus Hodarchaeales archaeon]
MFLAPVSDSEKLNQPEKAISPNTAGSRIRDNLMSLRFAILVFLLSFFMKLWETNSIRMWDEGWYADIAARMADTMENGGDWAFPVYMEFGLLRMFDKPPLIFWVTGFLIIILGRSTLALKLPIAFSGAMLAVIAYFLYSGDRDDRTAGALAGLMMAAAYFVNFYSRTAYIDITMVFLSSLTVLFAKRAIDAFVDHRNVRQGSFFLVLTGIVNALNLLLKAWQGLIVGPAIGIYLLVKVYQKETNLSRTREILESLEKLASLQRLAELFPNDSRKKALTSARSLSFISFSLVFFLFSSGIWGLLIGIVLLSLVISILFMILLSSDFPEEKMFSQFELAGYAIIGILLGSVLGFFSFLGLNFLVEFITPYYQVLEDLAHGIGDSGGGYAILYLGLP